MKNPFEVTRITFKNTSLIDENGDFHESYSVYEARKRARNLNLNLVCFNWPKDKNKLPLCKIINFGKFKYDQSKKNKKDKNASKSELKEIQFSPLIEENDIDHKVSHIKEFLEKGHEVQMVMKVKNRQILYIDNAKNKLIEIANKCDGRILSQKRNGNNIVIRMIKKSKNKS